jgi:hypothetical protein
MTVLQIDLKQKAHWAFERAQTVLATKNNANSVFMKRYQMFGSRTQQEQSDESVKLFT